VREQRAREEERQQREQARTEGSDAADSGDTKLPSKDPPAPAASVQLQDRLLRELERHQMQGIPCTVRSFGISQLSDIDEGDPFFFEHLLNDVSLVSFLDAARELDGVEFFHGTRQETMQFSFVKDEPALRACLEWAAAFDLEDVRKALAEQQLAAIRAWTCTPLCYILCSMLRSPHASCFFPGPLCPVCHYIYILTHTHTHTYTHTHTHTHSHTHTYTHTHAHPHPHPHTHLHPHTPTHPHTHTPTHARTHAHTHTHTHTHTHVRYANEECLSYFQTMSLLPLY
jgi:hypothetical protein